MLRILDFAKKSCPKMAGGCPAFGSGSYGSRNVATVTQVPRKLIAKRSKEEEELIARRFRDVSCLYVYLDMNDHVLSFLFLFIGVLPVLGDELLVETTPTVHMKYSCLDVKEVIIDV
jgi:hypothetical protein